MDQFSFAILKTIYAHTILGGSSSGSPKGKNGYNTNRLQLIWGAGLKKRGGDTNTKTEYSQSYPSTVIGMYTVQKANWLSIFSLLPSETHHYQQHHLQTTRNRVTCVPETFCVMIPGDVWYVVTKMMDN